MARNHKITPKKADGLPTAKRARAVVMAVEIIGPATGVRSFVQALSVPRLATVPTPGSAIFIPKAAKAQAITARNCPANGPITEPIKPPRAAENPLINKAGQNGSG